MKKAEVVFIPSPGIGHLVPTIEFAKALQIHSHGCLSATVLTMDAPFQTIPRGYTDSVTGIRFIELVPLDSPPPDSKHSMTGLSEFVENYKPHAKRAISQLTTTESTTDGDSVDSVSAVVVDMFMTNMVDVANDLGLPCYVYYTSGAAMLGLALHFPALDLQITGDIKDYSGELEIPSFKNSIPPVALPAIMWKRDDDYTCFLYHARRLSETKGIILNSFYELEPHAIDSCSESHRVYSVGPVIDPKTRFHSDRTQHDDVLKWLDNQPEASVVFLCFGSRGAFDAAQAHEIAFGLERSGHRFLWSLRPKPPSSVEEVLPRGFVERTCDRGMVCGWVPQMEVLGHLAVGCFVSHCGWNSTLESLWFGVPMLTWPQSAEQRLNALDLVRELGLAVELREYNRGVGEVTTAGEVERAVRSVMEGEREEVRERVKEMREKSRGALMEGGSSSVSIKSLIEDLICKE